MANYIINDTDLTSVASAIRTKGGTSGQLVFPSGFVSAINNIQTGSGGTSDELAKILIERKGTTNIYGETIFPEITELPSGITQIGDYAFYKAKLNLSFTIPSTVTTIGQYAFFGNGPMELSEGLIYIEKYAFASETPPGSTGLGAQTLTIPSTVTTIDDCAFSNLRIGTLNLNGKPNSISSTAFEDSVITTINVPWEEGEVSSFPWGATFTTINYNTTT